MKSRVVVLACLLSLCAPAFAGPTTCYPPNMPGNGTLCCKDGDCWVVQPK